MSWEKEKCIDFYYGEYKKGILGKKNTVRLCVYPTGVEGTGSVYSDDEWNGETQSFELKYDDLLDVHVEKEEKILVIDYIDKVTVNNKKTKVALFGIDNLEKWLELIENTKNSYIMEKHKIQQLKLQHEKEQQRILWEKEQKALQFYQECYSFHINESTPVYPLLSDKNRVVLIFIGSNRNLNFLKIDGYTQEENIGVVPYENIHYFEKAGSVSYVTDIHGKYTSFGGSMTGGSFSKLAAVGGGLLFGLMGMALGTALTYKPMEKESVDTSFYLDSDIKKIDDRNIILNFYSEAKKQYIDIELPKDIYNFLQTYFPEKKYSIVNELEKETALKQSKMAIEKGSFFKVDVQPDKLLIDSEKTQPDNSIEDFRIKVEKLKMMWEAGLLSDSKFEEEKEKLLKLI